MTDTVPVRFEVLGVEPVRGTGKLVALANVLVEVEGVQYTLQGVQVTHAPGGGLTCQAPQSGTHGTGGGCRRCCCRTRCVTRSGRKC